MLACRKILRGIVLLSAFTALAQSSIGPPPLIWQNEGRNYASFDQVKAVIANSGPTIYLSSLSGNGYAVLERWNDQTEIYEYGKNWTPHAAPGQHATSLEIQSNTQQEVGLDWQGAVDNPDNPTYFVLDKTHVKRPIAGKYRFVFSWSEHPWSAGTGRSPGGMYLSGNFVIGN
jgi:hypothetical protein